MNFIFKPVTIWITGLSASGKTTLGQSLYNGLINEGVKNVEFLDGEDVRHKLKEVYGYINRDRDALNLYKAKLALKSNKAGNIAIVTSISHKKDIRQKIRNYIGNFMEVYLKCPVDICAKRDYKGQYKRAFTGELDNFVGVTEAYEESEHVELALDTSAITVDECFQTLLETSLNFIHKKTKDAVFDREKEIDAVKN